MARPWHTAGLEERPARPPAGGKVRLRMLACGLCGIGLMAAALARLHGAASAAVREANPIFLQELTIKRSFSQARCFHRALAYIEGGRVRVDRIVTDELPLSEYGEALAGARERRSVKAMLTTAG